MLSVNICKKIEILRSIKTNHEDIENFFNSKFYYQNLFNMFYFMLWCTLHIERTALLKI